MNTATHLWRRHRYLLIFVLAISAIFAVLYVLRTVLFAFILGLVLAYLLMPIISWVENKLPRQGRWLKTKRVFLIVLLYLVVLGLIALLFFYVFTAVIEALLILVNNAPQFISSAINTLQAWAESFRQQMPPEMRQQMDQFFMESGVALGNAVRNMFLRGVSLIPSTLGLVFGLVVLPVFLFYLLKDWEKLGESSYSIVPLWAVEHTKNIISIIEGVLGRYIRAQLVLGFIVGYLCFIGLLILRVPFAPALAVFAGATELIPIVGPWMGGATAVIVTMAVAPEKAVWVAGLFLFVQLFENNLLVPKIQGSLLHIHPVVVLVVLVLGAYFAGFWGVLLAVPLTATIVEVYKYVSHTAQADDDRALPEA